MVGKVTDVGFHRERVSTSLSSLGLILTTTQHKGCLLQVAVFTLVSAKVLASRKYHFHLYKSFSSEDLVRGFPRPYKFGNF